MADVRPTFDPESHERRNVGSAAADEPGSFLPLMGHLYRGEISRSNAWRSRLDRTTNWAVVLTASLITWGFSSPERPHYVILVGMVMVAIFLFVEARRYRFYDIWRSRVRLLEENVWAHALHPVEGIEHREWRDLLSEDLRSPALKITIWEALSRRLRRIYMFLLLILAVAWVAHLTAFGQTNEGLGTAARIARIPGYYVWLTVSCLYLGAAFLASWPMSRRAKGAVTEDIDRSSDWKDS